jgi:hypothetical protein
MTDLKPRDRIVHPIGPEVRDRLAALKAGDRSPGSVIPDDVREAIHAGLVAQVVMYCDSDGFLWKGDVIGETRDERLANARAYLAADHGWKITDDSDLCPNCSTAEAHEVLDSINADLDRADGAR